MKKSIYILSILLLINFSLDAKPRTKQAIKIPVFENTPICFNPTEYPNGVSEKGGLIYLTNGRIAIKKIKLPKHKRFTQIAINISLVSNGDPWDKSGSCFVIPKKSKINMIDIAEGRAKYPQQDTIKYEQLVGIVQGKDYIPAVELMRFMTPFGVGHFSDNSDSVSIKRRPVYIDSWEEKVTWQEDITDLLPLLEDEVYIGVYIDTWRKDGYNIDVDLTFTESAICFDRKPDLHVESLINTNYYIGQQLADIFSRKDVPVTFSIPKGAKNIRLKYIATGHGGHAGGDEFHPQRNIISIDGEKVLDFLPWRTDCASFRRYNPTSGVWLKKREIAYISEEGKRAVKEIEEPIASSDLSRSNWCPGSDVPPVTVQLPNLKAGNHTLTISIPESTPISENKLNHWLVSAYLIWEM